MDTVTEVEKMIGYIVTVTEGAATTVGKATGAASTEAAANKGGATAMGTVASGGAAMAEERHVSVHRSRIQLQEQQHKK
jgi:hypothetical protein